MAVKKVVKTAKKATEVKTIADLQLELSNVSKDLNEFKRGHKVGELTNPRAITITRKSIARLQTAIRAAQILEQKGSK